MQKKPELVLDIAGVLATNFSPLFWESLSLKYDINYESLKKFKSEIRKNLWTGMMREEEFWLRLKRRFPLVDIECAKQELQSNIKPLPAIEKIAFWSEFANIHLLSNHCLEWVNPIINPYRKYIKSATISAVVGYCKPEAEIYLKVQSQLQDTGRVLFVDDQDKNLVVAKKLGWHTLLADERGDWMDMITTILKSL